MSWKLDLKTYRSAGGLWWNRKEGDGPGGTKHMHDTVLQHSGQVYVLDTTMLW